MYDNGGISVKAGVERRVLGEGIGGGFDKEVGDRELNSVGLSEVFAPGFRVGHVDFSGDVEVWDGAFAIGHGFANGLAHAR